MVGVRRRSATPRRRPTDSGSLQLTPRVSNNTRYRITAPRCQGRFQTRARQRRSIRRAEHRCREDTGTGAWQERRDRMQATQASKRGHTLGM